MLTTWTSHSRPFARVATAGALLMDIGRDTSKSSFVNLHLSRTPHADPGQLLIVEEGDDEQPIIKQLGVKELFVIDSELSLMAK